MYVSLSLSFHMYVFRRRLTIIHLLASSKGVRKKEWHLFGDLSLKILREITEGGLWVCVFGARVLGRHVER